LISPPRAAAAATQFKYLIVRGSDKKDEVGLFDWGAGRSVKIEQQAQMDVAEQTLATYSRQGELRLANVTDDALEARTILPAPWLPTLRVANASPSLENIVVGVRGDAGLFLTATGNRVMPFQRATGAWFAGDEEAYIAEAGEDGSTGRIDKVSPNRKTPTAAWSPTFKSDPRFTILDTHLGGPALFVLEQTSIYVFPDGHPESPGNQQRDKLRALDLKTGRELWLRQWVHHQPIELWSGGV
jgi:hypothetical protein